MYENVDYYEDVMSGQRGFGRNIDRLSNQLINFYHTRFPSQAKETLSRVEQLNFQLNDMDIDTLTKESLLPKSQQKSRLDNDDAAANKKKDSEDENEDE